MRASQSTASQIETVRLLDIDPNAMRDLDRYPFNAKKIEALRRSIRDLGLWEGVIGRRKGNRVEIAFGHHRIEAVRQELGEDAEANVIVRDLSDRDMVEFMGRENAEAYNTDFLILLETWEAGVKFLVGSSIVRRVLPKNCKILILLSFWDGRDPEKPAGRGWPSIGGCGLRRGLQAGSGRMAQKEALSGISVDVVQQLCQRVVAQHEAVEKMAKVTQRPNAEVHRAKKHLGNAANYVAHKLREGTIAKRDVRVQVDFEAFRQAKTDKRPTPLFEVFGEALVKSIAKVGMTDAIGEKLAEVEQALPLLELPTDIEIVKRLGLECHNAAGRFARWEITLTDPQRKVVPLKSLSKGGGRR